MTDMECLGMVWACSFGVSRGPLRALRVGVLTGPESLARSSWFEPAAGPSCQRWTWLEVLNSGSGMCRVAQPGHPDRMVLVC